MKYNIVFEKPAEKFILRQPKAQQQRILSAIYRLPDSGDIKMLKGYHGYYRLRVGDYRIIYTINDNKLIIRIVNAGNRGDIYK